MDLSRETSPKTETLHKPLIQVRTDSKHPLLFIPLVQAVNISLDNLKQFF